MSATPITSHPGLVRVIVSNCLAFSFPPAKQVLVARIPVPIKTPNSKLHPLATSAAAVRNLADPTRPPANPRALTHALCPQDADRELVEELLRQLVSNERLIARLVRSDAFLDRMAADSGLMAELDKRQTLLAKVADK